MYSRHRHKDLETLLVSVQKQTYKLYSHRLELCVAAGTDSEIDLCIWYTWSRRKSSLRHSRIHSERNTEITMQKIKYFLTEKGENQYSALSLCQELIHFLLQKQAATRHLAAC